MQPQVSGRVTLPPIFAAFRADLGCKYMCLYRAIVTKHHEHKWTALRVGVGGFLGEGGQRKRRQQVTSPSRYTPQYSGLYRGM